MEAKYIVFKHNGLEYPILFPVCLSHEDVVLKFNIVVVSAGFCKLGEEFWTKDGVLGRKLIAYGKSISLGKMSRAQDCDVLTRSFNFQIVTD